MWEVLKIPEGEILEDDYEAGVRFIVMRGVVSLCAYIGIPEDHILAGLNCDQLPLDCHGGLTYASVTGNLYLPEGLYWYGWSYAHSGDANVHHYGANGKVRFAWQGLALREWTVDEVKAEAKEACWQFRGLIQLSLTVIDRAIGPVQSNEKAVIPQPKRHRLVTLS